MIRKSTNVFNPRFPLNSDVGLYPRFLPEGTPLLPECSTAGHIVERELALSKFIPSC